MVVFKGGVIEVIIVKFFRMNKFKIKIYWERMYIGLLNLFRFVE